MAGELVHIESPDGTRLGVERLGDGPPLLLVHGGTADRSRWAPVRSQLASRFSLWLLDRRGRGDSLEESQEPYAIGREGDDVIAVLGAIGEPAYFLGHSYGALIGLEVLPRTDRILKALLYEPPFDTPGHRIVPPGTIDEIEARIEAGDREGALVQFYERIIGIDPTPMKGTPIWEARLVAVHTLVREARIGLEFTPDPASYRGLTTPVRLMLGETSPPPFHAAVEAAAAALPGSDIVELPGQGHTMIDAAPEAFVEQVLDFFER
jgi:pimeloyl-ACP methyl ester carboxylesterase